MGIGFVCSSLNGTWLRVSCFDHLETYTEFHFMGVGPGVIRISYILSRVTTYECSPLFILALFIYWVTTEAQQVV